MTDSYTQGVARRPVLELRAGDRVDLQGDVFADPTGYAGGESNPVLECEFQIVESVERETPDCVCVYFENWNPVGFPADHLVDVDGEQVRKGGRA